MATAAELLTQLQNLINSILEDEAPINSVNTTAHRSMLQKNIDAITAHINDAEAHGAGGLPVAQVGSLLAYLGEAWGGIAPGAAGQGLLIEFQDPNYMPVWRDLIPHINLAYENNGYCYTGVDDTNVGYVSCNNVRVYIPQLSKYVYLAVADSKTFQLSIPVNTVGGFTNAYSVINKADLLAAANGAKVTLSVVDEIAATHVVLLETMAGSNTSAARTSGMLQSLSNEYRLLNNRREEITITGGIASLDTSKYDKTEGQFYVESAANFEINTPGTFLLGKGDILIKNTGANPITVTFNQSFYYQQIEIEAGGKRLYKYLRETSTSSRLSIFPVYSSETPFTQVEDDTAPVLGGDLVTNNKRILCSQGDDIASTNNLILDSTLNGNTYVITGTTQVNLIEILDWQDGAEITLQFAGILTLSHDATPTGNFAPIILAKGADYTTAPGNTISFKLINGEWFEISNTKESGGGGGSLAVSENGGTQYTESLLDIITNGLSVLTNNSGVKNVLSFLFRANADVDTTGEQAGSLYQVNSAVNGLETVQTKIDDKLELAVEANRTADILLSTILKAGYELDGLIIKNETANAVTGGIDIGTTASGNDIVSAEAVGANAEVDATIIKKYWSGVNDTDLYISAVTAWNSANLTLYFTFKKRI